MYYVHSTTTNCPPAPPPPGESVANDQPGTSSGGDEEDTPGKKCKTKSEQVCEEQFNKLLKVVEQEDHLVELALAALVKQMICSLSTDEQDELLEDLRAVSDKFFRECRRRLHEELNSSCRCRCKCRSKWTTTTNLNIKYNWKQLVSMKWVQETCWWSYKTYHPCNSTMLNMSMVWKAPPT